MSKIIMKDFMVPTKDSGSVPSLKLFVRHKYQEDTLKDPKAKTLLYIHGASQPSEVVFDLPVFGQSWADHLAAKGYDVWMMNVRGYGRSQWPSQTDKPVATTEEAI